MHPLFIHHHITFFFADAPVCYVCNLQDELQPPHHFFSSRTTKKAVTISPAKTSASNSPFACRASTSKNKLESLLGKEFKHPRRRCAICGYTVSYSNFKRHLRNAHPSHYLECERGNAGDFRDALHTLSHEVVEAGGGNGGGGLVGHVVDEDEDDLEEEEEKVRAHFPEMN